MQKKLLSLLFVSSCSLVYAQEAQKNVPIITPEQHEKNKQQCAESKAKINSLSSQLLEEKEKKYALELELHGHDQRNTFIEKLVIELSHGGDRLLRHKDSSNTAVEEQGKDKKKKAGAIEGSLWGWFTPEQESMCAQEVQLIDKLTAGKKDINEKLYKEIKGYHTVVENRIFPELREQLGKLYIGMDTLHLQQYQTCRKLQGDEYCKCLEGSVLSEDQVDKKIDSKLYNAYVKAVKEGAPITLEQFKENAKYNKTTREIVAKIEALREELKREIRREVTDPESEKSAPELKPETPQN